MVSALKPTVRILPDADALAGAVAQSVFDRISATVKVGARFSMMLSGGNSPRGLYRCLASEHGDHIPWEKVQLFWGDERYVPQNDPHSNYRMAREALLDHISIPAKNIHPMPTDYADPEDAARAYERTLQNYFSPPWPRFNLVLLGLGSDGHTASLFPGSSALGEKERWFVAANGPVDPRQRLTVTLPVLIHSDQIYFLVAGADKAETLRRVLSGSPSAQSYPAARVIAASPAVVLWADRAAAALVQAPSRSGSLDLGSTATGGEPVR